MLTLPAASRARARSVCDPSATVTLSQLMLYGAAPSSAPTSAPSRRNCTPLTPTSSSAPAVTDRVPLTVDPAAGAVTDTVGGVVSLGAVNDTVLSELVAAALVLPAASVAAPAGTLATTRPDPVIPVTATV